MQVREKIEARRKEDEQGSARPRAPLTDRQIAELKQEVAGHMLVGAVCLGLRKQA